MAGFRAGWNWIAESAAVEFGVVASAGSSTAGIGGRVTAGTGTPVMVEVTLASVPDTVVPMYDQQGPRWQGNVDGGGTATIRWTTQSRYSRWGAAGGAARGDERRGRAHQLDLTSG